MKAVSLLRRHIIRTIIHLQFTANRRTSQAEALGVAPVQTGSGLLAESASQLTADAAGGLWSCYADSMHAYRRSKRVQKKTVVLVRKRTIPTERPQPVGEVSTYLADRGCRVVSATDPHGRNRGFLDPEPLLFHSSSSSIILTGLSGPRSRPTTSEKIW
jgi:hypothetical protein